MQASKTSRTLMALAAALSVASCGGDSNFTPAPAAAPPANPLVPGTDVPVSATTSADGAFDFVALLAATLNETGEPLVLGDAVLATSETDEPRPVQ